MKRFLALFVAFASLLSILVMAHSTSKLTTSQTIRDIVFSEAEKRVMHDYFSAERQVVGNDLVLIVQGTGIVLDILRDAITKGTK